MPLRQPAGIPQEKPSSLGLRHKVPLRDNGFITQKHVVSVTQELVEDLGKSNQVPEVHTCRG